ncbi:MAG TPA: hypothetical protein VMW63_01715 [Methanoregulaceae archaeon]|nr:hypothetical protein [Methanoregulaceae archaeon]
MMSFLNPFRPYYRMPLQLFLPGSFIFAIILLSLLIPVTYAEEPSVEWDQIYSLGISSQALDVIQTQDGGFAIAGITVVSEVPLQHNPVGKNYDAFLIRTNGEGRELWNKTYGTTTMSDGAYTVRETLDGGFIIAGYGNAYLIRTDSSGNVIWEQHYEQSPGLGAINGVCELADGNFIIAGETSRDRPYWNRDAYLAKIDRNGEIIWDKLYPGGYTGGNPGGARSLDCIGDGGYLLCVHGSPALIRTDERGRLIWMADHDTPLAYARLSPDGGAIATGITVSPDTGYPVLFLLKTDSWGITEWETLSPDIWGSGSVVEVTSDGGYLATGTAIILKGGMTAEKTIPFNSAITLVKIDGDGNILWNTTLSPGPFNEGMMVRKTSDGGYIVLGNTADEAGQESLYFMGYLTGRIYLAKLGGMETTVGDAVQSASISPTAHADANGDVEEVPIMEIPIGYAPLFAILVVLIMACWKRG